MNSNSLREQLIKNGTIKPAVNAPVGKTEKAKAKRRAKNAEVKAAQ